MISNRVFVWARCLSLCLLIVSALAGCLSPPKSAVLKEGWSRDPSAFHQRSLWRDELTRWKLSAKISIKTSDTRESANFIWQRNGQQHTVRLFGPLGAGSIKLDFDPAGAVLTDSRGKKYYGVNEEVLLESLTGWQIPLKSLRHWLFALPDPRFVFQYVNNDAAELTRLAQLGWEIEYDKYAPETKLLPGLPRKIVAQKGLDAEDGTDQARVRLVVKKWEWPESERTDGVDE